MNPAEWSDAREHTADEPTLQMDLDALAASIVPDPAFTAELETRLQRAHRAQFYARRPLYQRIAQWPRLSPRFAVGILLALLCSMLLGIPVLAQMGVLKYFVPYEVTRYPSPQAIMPPIPSTIAAVEPVQALDLATLEHALGFPIRAPKYLPNDCPLWRYAYISQSSAAFLSYTCVDILEQKAVADWRNNPLRQPVGPNAVQTLSIGGQPAYYIEGTWQFGATGNGTLTPPVWVPTGARRLVLERGDVVIDLAAIPESLSNGIVSGLISKAELIQIAESMK